MVQVLFPSFVVLAVVLFAVGLLRRQSWFVLLGSFFAFPLCIYFIGGFHRWWFLGPFAWVSSLAAPWALKRGWTATAALLVIPYLGVIAIVTWWSMTQPELPW